ncbi:YndJ family protein [Bacillus stercoris]|uniref:YndJ family protein n=1 Tax=Bacillus TaxID=1386 RepID=UPI00249BB799|nr:MULTISPECIES: YndJ family protein [Bacillus]MDN0190524.1 YndJ family protein [Bacillus sp. B.PNR1]MDN3031430.1 YndJ family protein [Bacillus sp. B.PNR2]WGV93486.1 YndJ family protein [Bacillus stercoris]WGV97261.1 YndJ family protein [Bacillus stercoris]
MKRNGIVSALCFIGFIAAEAPDISVAEALVLLSILFFVPGIFPFVFRQSQLRAAQFIEYGLIQCYPAAAFFAVLALVTEIGGFALIWWMYTVFIALYAILRLWETKIHRIEETSVLFGLIYLAGGGFWFFAYAAHLQIMQFAPLIILLTAVHFHYSAFLIPIFNGLLGRTIRKHRKLYNWITWVILLSPLLIALGITYSKTLDVIAVSIYMAAIYLHGFLVFTAAFRTKTGAFLIRLSSAVLMITIAFSMIYSFGVFRQEVTLTINQMIWIHGFVNAFGVILPALIGWRIEDPKPFDAGRIKTFSHIFGKRKIGKDFLANIQAESNVQYSGLVDDMGSLRSKDFSPEKLAPLILSFYEQTIEYNIKAKVTWNTWFRPLAIVYEWFSRRTGQIHLSTNPDWYRMFSEIKGVHSKKDGREKVRAWIRTNEKKETIFTALYSMYRSNGEGYMNISLPLPFSSMTGILKPYHHQEKLILTSRRRKSRAGDEGIYLQTRAGTYPLPLSETFLIEAAHDNKLTAVHHMWLFGIKFLTVHYSMTHINRPIERT